MRWYAHGATPIIDRDLRLRLSQLIDLFFCEMQKQKKIDGAAQMLTLCYTSPHFPQEVQTDNL